MKTNAVRILDENGISYELRQYSVDLNDLTAETVAQKIGLPLPQVFKTLVAKGDRNGVCLGVVPGHRELNLKTLAQMTGDRRVELVSLKEVQLLTGYVRGGVTALGGRKDYPVFLDESAFSFEQISISAGMRGLQILLHPLDYQRVTKATAGSIAKEGSLP